MTRSLALLSDAAHMFTDVAALGIALAAVQIAKRPDDRQRTFGYYRFEILAAALNAVLLLPLARRGRGRVRHRCREPGLASRASLGAPLAVVLNALESSPSRRNTSR